MKALIGHYLSFKDKFTGNLAQGMITAIDLSEETLTVMPLPHHGTPAVVHHDDVVSIGPKAPLAVPTW